MVSGFELQLKFRHTVNGAPILWDSLRYENAHQETYSFSRISYLLTGFALQDATGRWIPLSDSFAWIDGPSSRNQVALTDIPEGRYHAIRFHIGPESEQNHGDPTQYAADHPLNPNLNKLHWDWQSGYIFLALEGRYRDANESKTSGYVYHYANNPQRTAVTLPLPIDLKATSLFEIDFDLGKLFNTPGPISFHQHGASTHSRKGDLIPVLLKKNLPHAFQVTKVRSAAMSPDKVRTVPIDLPAQYTPFPFKMSRTFPVPDLPVDNPLITERVVLGKKLFHDTRLSLDGTIACASCHKEPAALSDNVAQSTGIYGQLSRRHSMPLFNLAWKDRFFWDGRAETLRAQSLMPIVDPTEMNETLPSVIQKLDADPEYKELFARAFASGAISAENIGLAFENFLLSQTSYSSRFDQATQGKTTLREQERRGLELFMTEFEPRSGQYGADCFHCHGGALFTDNRFHDNGLRELIEDRGLEEATGDPLDAHKFATPSLRNVALTAPYMHDGRFNTLEEVVEHYSTGVVNRDTLDPNLAKHPAEGLNLNDADKAALVAFLRTLTDPQYAVSN